MSDKANKRWRRAALASVALGLLSNSLVAQETPAFPNLATQPSTATANAAPTQRAPMGVPQANVRLEHYNVPSELIGPVGAQLQAEYHQDPNVSVTTDPKTGQLMVMAPDSIHQQIAYGVAELLKHFPQGDKGMQVASTRTSGYDLRNLSWRELEDALKQLAGARLTVTTERNGELANFRISSPAGAQDILQVDRRGNRVTFFGGGPSVTGWNKVIYSLDQGQADPETPTHIVPLAPAEPRRVKRAIQLVSATTQVSGGQQTEAQVELNDDSAAMAMGTFDTLGADSGLFGDVQIEFIEEIDLVIIRGSKRDVQRVLEVIEKIKEQADETQPEVDVFTLQHANAEAVEALVTELYEEIYAPRQGTVSITALGQPNALLLIGRKEVVESVKELVSKIDQPLDPQDQLKVIRLRNAASVDVQDRIREFFTQEPPSGDQRIGLGTRVKVLADYRTNSLIIQASPREMVEVEKLIAELDVEESSTENVVQVFRLKNTLAEDLLEVIEGVIGGQTTGGDESLATPPSSKLSIVNVDGGSIESGILAGVIVTADPSVNALVVRAPAASMDLLAKLIDELDSLPSAEAVIKVFDLANGDATTMASTLQSLFGLARTAGQSAQNNFFTNISQSALTTGGEGSLVQLQIAAEARTNSVIVSGSESDMKVIEALVYRLDADVRDQRRAEVVWLQNATALNVANALSTYFQNLNQSQQQLISTQIVSAQEYVNLQVFVVPEEATNSVLVSASPEYFDMAIRLIERLDRRPPMVSIQVLVAEIELNDSFELGAEWGIQDGLLYDRRSATGGTLGSPVFNLLNPVTPPTVANNVAGQALSSLGTGILSSTGDAGGLLLSASSDSVGVLVRALQTAGRIQILNRPQLTTLDSQIATAQVGQTVPRVTGLSQATGVAPQQIITTDENVGLLLSVLPRVSPDGLILMQVGVENSALSDEGIVIGFSGDAVNQQPVESPIINRTRADTVVSAYSGQTVVFAGLISKARGSSRRQIPVLGSLPWIGAAFRYDVEEEQRRELMVVLTPRLIQTDEDYEMLKQIETSRMSWCLADVLNLHSDVGLQGGNGLWGPARSSTMYPDRIPTPLQLRGSPAYEGNLPTYNGPAYQGMEPEDYVPPTAIPLGQSESGVISPSDEPKLDSSAQKPGSSVFRPVGYQQPAVQSGPYR